MTDPITVTERETSREAWERLASDLPPQVADAAEENAADLGLEPDTEAFWAECIAQVTA
jgi:methylase of polypeptide subunit release factors